MDLAGLAAGAHELTVVAVDNAGNQAELSMDFEVVVSFETVAALVDRYHEAGTVSRIQRGQLLGHLARAEQDADRGRTDRTDAQLARFEAVAARVSDRTARRALIAAAETLRDQLCACPGGGVQHWTFE